MRYMGQKPREVGPAGQYIASELRAQRARLGWTLEDVAKKAGLARSTVGRVLSAERIPDVDQLIALCTAMSLDVRQLIDEASRQH